VQGIGRGTLTLAAVPVSSWARVVTFAEGLGFRGAGGPLEEPSRELCRTAKRAMTALRRAGNADSTDPLTAAQRKLDLVRALDPDLAAAPPVTGLRQEVVFVGETIRDLALRILGDEFRWKEIAVLNDLLPPYVTPLGGPGLLVGGGTVLVPSSARGARSAALPDAAGRTPLAIRLYGTDIALDDPAGEAVAFVREERPGGERVFDLALIAGVPNLVQAVHRKALTAPGELKQHADYGFALPIGGQLTPLTLFFSKVQAARTLLADDRIESIEDLSLSGRHDVARLSVRVVAVGTGQVVRA